MVAGMNESLLQRLQRFDETRPNIPGEHWLALAAGVGLWLATRRHPSIAVRLLASLAGTLLIVRAGSGREVPQLLNGLPFADRQPDRKLDLLG
jgi:hypothetical protein